MSPKIEEKIVEAIKKVYDPEIPVNIYELGLIYKIDVKKDGLVDITMTLTSPFCPVAGSLPEEVETLSLRWFRTGTIDLFNCFR